MKKTKKQLENFLFLDFKNWLIGIFEDDPLPPEITTIYFYYGKLNNIIYIRMLGTEIDKEELSDFTYNPLEAQFFYSKYLFDLFLENIDLKQIEEFILNKIHQLNKVYELQELNLKKIKIKQCSFYLG